MYYKNSITIKFKFTGKSRFELSRRISARLGDASFLRIGRRPIFVHGDLAMGDLKFVIEIIGQEVAALGGDANCDFLASAKSAFEPSGLDWENLARTFRGTRHESGIATEVADPVILAPKMP